MAVGTFDRAVLVTDAQIVAGRRHAVMGAERLVASRQIFLGVGVQITKSGRKAVATMLFGRAAQRPQGVLQPFGQSHEAFAPEHDMGVLESGEGQTEVIEAAIEDLAGDRDAEISHLGEVRQSHSARRVLLAKDHLAIGAVHRPPPPDPTLQRPSRAGAQLGMPTTQFLEDGDRPQSRRRLQHGNDVVVPDVGEGIGPPSLSARPLLARKPGFLPKTVGGGRAEAGLRG